jgi:ABC-type Fe3+/spermidine/putrescine transport system ATPase subunit
LLQRFYDATAGVIYFNGVDIKTIDLKLHRKRIGIVTQDPVLFSGTILSNITYGMPNATKEEAIQAATRANAHDFICSMPDGYETQVSTKPHWNHYTTTIESNTVTSSSQSKGGGTRYKAFWWSATTVREACLMTWIDTNTPLTIMFNTSQW